VDAGLVAAELGKALQIRDNALSVDGWHVFASFSGRGDPPKTNLGSRATETACG
jgi:hypothetical protein